MFFLRVFGKTLLFAAFLAMAYDGARMLATPNEGLLLTPISTYLKTLIPNGRENLEQFFLALGLQYVWTGIAEPLLSLPASVLFGILGVLLFLAGYRRPRPEMPGD